LLHRTIQEKNHAHSKLAHGHHTQHSLCVSKFVAVRSHLWKWHKMNRNLTLATDTSHWNTY